MRTTLVIDDGLFRAAKKRAAALGITLSEVVNDALRGALSPSNVSPTEEFRMPTFGDGLPEVHREPDEMARALEDEGR